MKCASCGGPYHEATGHRHSPEVVICGPCARSFMAWLKAHLHRRWGKLKFYDYAVTSVRTTVSNDDCVDFVIEGTAVGSEHGKGPAE